jgi:hypothetical protein
MILRGPLQNCANNGSALNCVYCFSTPDALNCSDGEGGGEGVENPAHPFPNLPSHQFRIKRYEMPASK